MDTPKIDLEPLGPYLTCKWRQEEEAGQEEYV